MYPFFPWKNVDIYVFKSNYVILIYFGFVFEINIKHKYTEIRVNTQTKMVYKKHVGTNVGNTNFEGKKLCEAKKNFFWNFKK